MSMMTAPVLAPGTDKAHTDVYHWFNNQLLVHETKLFPGLRGHRLDGRAYLYRITRISDGRVFVAATDGVKPIWFSELGVFTRRNDLFNAALTAD